MRFKDIGVHCKSVEEEKGSCYKFVVFLDFFYVTEILGIQEEAVWSWNPHSNESLFSSFSKSPQFCTPQMGMSVWVLFSLDVSALHSLKEMI